MKPDSVVAYGTGLLFAGWASSALALWVSRPEFVMDDLTPSTVSGARLSTYSFLIGLISMLSVFVYAEVIDPEI